MRNLPELRPYRSSLFGEGRDLFSDMVRNFFGSELRAMSEGWTPAADVIEAPQAFVISIDAPGVDPEEIEVTLVGDTLTVKGERKPTERAESEHVHLAERVSGAFLRSFSFPTPVAADGVDASAKNGVLTIKVAKAKEALPKKVAIKTR